MSRIKLSAIAEDRWRVYLDGRDVGQLGRVLQMNSGLLTAPRWLALSTEARPQDFSTRTAAIRDLVLKNADFERLKWAA
jgi:hypothetical protein